MARLKNILKRLLFPPPRNIMIGATGGGVCVMVLGMALFMIVQASKQLRQINTQNT